MTYAPVKIPYKSWNPPNLSLKEELELGAHIAKTGKKNFVDSFTKKLYAYDSSETNARESASPTSKFIIVSVLIFALFALFKYAPHVALQIVIVSAASILVWYGSAAWASIKFNRWVDRLLAQYAEYSASRSEKLN